MDPLIIIWMRIGAWNHICSMMLHFPSFVSNHNLYQINNLYQKSWLAVTVKTFGITKIPWLWTVVDFQFNSYSTQRHTIHTILPRNYATPVYGVATICHQVRWLRWGHPSLFHTATSPLIWYKIFCVRDILYRLIWMEFINMFSVYAQSGTQSRFNWWIIVILTYNPSVLMCVEITDAPQL